MEEEWTKKLDRPVFAIGWSLLWLYLHNFPHVFGHINSLVTAYRERQYQVVEGQVQVLHEQPATGHTKGDIITVNGKQFEVNYFYATLAYRNTLAHGGVLGSGVYARIYDHNGEIPSRGYPEMTRSDDLYSLPPDLPIPANDGSCDHLPGSSWPSVLLRSTRGTYVSLAAVRAAWLVVYCYPRTGLPNKDPPGGLAAWDSIPGARGCTPQACSYGDHHAELVQHGAHVFGVSTQDTEYQRDVVDRLHLPFELLSDSELELARALQLPTFSVAGQTLIKRLTLVGCGGRIEKCFYPVFPPNADAGNVLRYIRGDTA